MEEMLYTVKETAKILKTNTDYVYALIKKGKIRCLKLGSYKIRKTTLEAFLSQYEGCDLSDLDNIVPLENKN
ncbi:helix-turn-helix domain-containing protein [Clostridium tertium]|jgi:excisionase family DNA binding protein|uniref:helix-turn-helix domain-containing protein n=1 Tax=Clostridium TaxID=1485 RepID=UPI001C1E1EE3|nr:MULTISPECIES: helix-turn-helix domain-containing protein [Clostridium]MBU6134899.1 helix-turn-helix domain-containing protein [Clostridium tertium]MDB1956598.1 helix-turn-helix domain-containing protein [Clostridium tertium]MDB1958469.1 helix-turn-helix domain-containing protein [Clostridium tertium]MDB1962360.1 helix-turn-helix domain-containing protein [Clostridium tertium]MDB1967650.1 helix-turn-helix domain-containing protein [Clostridium tertium]